MKKSADGLFSAFVEGVSPGDRYRYRVDGRGPFPDPASRFQPEGVHGPSEVIDPRSFSWSDSDWRGSGLDGLVIYEIHVGTFTSEGTFSAVADRLPALVDLGVSAIELMPVADFPGHRNWGYDGVALFSPARCYGKPDDLRRLVDAAHLRGLAVILDVVYNHLGPDGNYLSAYSPFYFSSRHRSPWGQGLNFDGERSSVVRGFFIENALHWIHEYHADGLRLDATHAIVDESPRHFLAELAAKVHAFVSGRRVLLIVEDSRNLAQIVRPANEGGWGLDAVWADDFHHQVRRILTGDSEGYYRDYSGSSEDLASTIRKGWFYCGQHSVHLDGPRGTDPAGVPPRRFVFCIQNHDQVGNRAFGERLHHQVDPAAYRAATTLLLTCPQTPLLFMGQEWAASSPFLFFTDHNPELGQNVSAGRREEFRYFPAFSDPMVREQMPDPQAESTFLVSKLDWDELEAEPHAGVLRLCRDLLHLRSGEPALAAAGGEDFAVDAVDEGGIAIRRIPRAGPAILAIVRLEGAGAMDLRGHPVLASREGKNWETVLTTEDARYAIDPMPPRIDLTEEPVIQFCRPGALVLREAIQESRPISRSHPKWTG